MSFVRMPMRACVFCAVESIVAVLLLDGSVVPCSDPIARGQASTDDGSARCDQSSARLYHWIGDIYQCQSCFGILGFLRSVDRGLDGLWPALHSGKQNSRVTGVDVYFQGALCYAELGCAYVSSGGDYTYLRVAFGDFPGFLRVWIEVVLSRPMIVVLSVLTASNYLVYWFYPTCLPPAILVKCLSSFLLLIVGLINLISATWTNRFHQLCNYFKIGKNG